MKAKNSIKIKWFDHKIKIKNTPYINILIDADELQFTGKDIDIPKTSTYSNIPLTSGYLYSDGEMTIEPTEEAPKPKKETKKGDKK